MKIFQTEVGVELFATHPLGISLTEKGFELARLGDSLMRIFKNPPRLQEDAERGDVSHLGVTTRLSSTIVPEISKLLEGSDSLHRIIVRDLSDITLEAAVLDGSLDAALLYDPPLRKECSSVSIMAEELVFVHPPVWALELPRRYLKAREFASYPLINVRADTSTRVLVDRFCQKQGLRPLYGLEVDQHATMIAMVLQGLGSAVCHRSTVRNELRRGSLLAHGIGSPPIVGNLKLYFRRESENSKHVVRLLALVRMLIFTEN